MGKENRGFGGLARAGTGAEGDSVLKEKDEKDEVEDDVAVED